MAAAVIASKNNAAAAKIRIYFDECHVYLIGEIAEVGGAGETRASIVSRHSHLIDSAAKLAGVTIAARDIPVLMVAAQRIVDYQFAIVGQVRAGIAIVGYSLCCGRWLRRLSLSGRSDLGCVGLRLGCGINGGSRGYASSYSLPLPVLFLVPRCDCCVSCARAIFVAI